MICETCDALLADYKRALDTFKTAVEKSRGAVGVDACYAAKLAADLADNCGKAPSKDGIDIALITARD